MVEDFFFLFTWHLSSLPLNQRNQPTGAFVPSNLSFHVKNLISAAIFGVKISSLVVELDELKVWQSFKLLGLKRQRPTSLKGRLLRDLGHFYHQTHYANRQSRGLLCQRAAAAAFRGSVQDHQVLMSQERKSAHRHHTFHFIPAHSAQPYMQHSGAPQLSAARLCFLCV